MSAYHTKHCCSILFSAASVMLRVVQALVNVQPYVATERSRKFSSWYFFFCIKEEVHPQPVVQLLYQA